MSVSNTLGAFDIAKALPAINDSANADSICVEYLLFIMFIPEVKMGLLLFSLPILGADSSEVWQKLLLTNDVN
jgi:hypothetical protein